VAVSMEPIGAVAAHSRVELLMAGSLHSTLLELYQVGLRCQVSTPWTHKPFIYKRRLIPQAGDRRWAAGKCRLTGGNSENLCPQALFREIPSCPTRLAMSSAAF